MDKCSKCGQPLLMVADRVSVSGMFENHLFMTMEGKTVDEVIDSWLDQISKPYPAIVDGKEIDDLGATHLCPVIVLSDKQELRRVGKMLFAEKGKPKDKKALKEYRKSLLDDPDIPRLLANG